jgi:hypothetical protein
VDNAAVAADFRPEIAQSWATKADQSSMLRYPQRSRADSVSESIEQERLLLRARCRELERITEEVRGAELWRLSVGR